jgi:hypothetical protein
MAEKQVLAWWMRQRTTVGRRWVSERLGMGEASGVSKAIRRVKESGQVELNRIKGFIEGGGECVVLSPLTLWRGNRLPARCDNARTDGDNPVPHRLCFLQGVNGPPISDTR